MADEIVPQAGDVWIGSAGDVRFMTKNKGELTWRDIQDDYWFFTDDPDWFATARRVFPPAAPGDVIPHGQSHALDVDHFERVRSLHRVVRALHDGECPNCCQVFPSEQVRVSDIRNECPQCGFNITTEEANAVSKEFAPVMAKNMAVFKDWRASRE